MTLRSWRWWHFLAAGLAILFLSLLTLGLCLRMWSVARLSAVEARLRAEGRPTRFDEIMATAPVRDAADDRAWLALEARWDSTSGPGWGAAKTWLEAGAPSPMPPAVAAWLTENASLLADTVAVLSHDGLAIGTWPDGTAGSLAQLWYTRSTSFGAPMGYITAFAASSVEPTDGARLAEFDRLVAKVWPNCLCSMLTQRFAAAARDHAQLLALLRRPADASMQAWAASPPITLAGGLAGIRGERLLVAAAHPPDGSFNNSLMDLHQWALGPSEAAVVVAGLAAFESTLEGGPWIPVSVPFWAPRARAALPHPDWTWASLTEADALERAARIAAALITAWRGGTAPPIDQAALPDALRARLAPTGPGSSTLRYLRRGDGFIIEIDPAAPRPPGVSRAATPLEVDGPLVMGAGVAVGGPPVP